MDRLCAWQLDRRVTCSSTGAQQQQQSQSTAVAAVCYLTLKPIDPHGGSSMAVVVCVAQAMGLVARWRWRLNALRGGAAAPTAAAPGRQGAAHGGVARKGKGEGSVGALHT
eukprot:scaffold91509_cov34-Tisochrysis_lutea.AAC.1